MLMQISSAQELERFCSLPAPSVLTPAMLEQSRADTHLMLDENSDAQARCSLWWSDTPGIPGHRVGLIGHYAARDAHGAARLLRFACEELARQGCTLAIGPMDGSTNRRYRLLSERGTQPPFFLEPDNPDDWPGHFTGNGFSILAHYYSALQIGLDREDPRVPALEQQFAYEGVTIRALDSAHFEEELHRIYHLVIASFRDNFLAGPITEAEFLEMNRPLLPYLRPELVLLAEHEEELIGFSFNILDWLEMQRQDRIDTLIVKTLAVHPAYASRGLGTLLAGRTRKVAHELGYRRAIHALMHEGNRSRRISQANSGEIIRRYALYARELREQP